MTVSIDSSKETVQELKEQLNWERQILKTIIDNLPSSIFVKDKNGRRLVVNKVNYTNAGFSSELDLIGKTDFEIFPRQIAEKFQKDDSIVYDKGQPIIGREEQVIRSDGRETWQITEKYPLKDQSGQIQGIVGFGHDITAEKQLEKEGSIAAAKLKEQQEMVQKMIMDLATIPDKIGDLVNGIQNVSKQTKMVAINASIEAARAGEYGRGFEIVASKVGELSDESGKAAHQVQEAIDEVNSLVQEILQLWEEVKQSN